MHGDLSDPEDILTSPGLNECIDLGQPAVVVLGAVLHFRPDHDAFRVIEHIKRVLRKGSYLIVSHATADDVDENLVRKAKEIYKKLDPLTYRTRGEVTRFFDGWEIVDPGVVSVNDWRPVEKVESPAVLYGGVACKP